MRYLQLFLTNFFVFTFLSTALSQVIVLDTSETTPSFTISNNGLNKIKISTSLLQSNITNGKYGFIVVSKPFTYNSNDLVNEAVVLSANPTGNASANARYIAPMQGFWVRTAQGQTGSLGFTYAMTEVNHSGAGQLRNTSAEKIVARINVNFGNQKDQMLAILSPNAQNGFECFDSEKMFIPGIVQVYAPNSGKKLVINSVRNNKSKISIPVAIECPANGWYNFELAELEMTNGILFLEDKVQGTMHNLGIDAIYSFFSNSGVVANRFVLHFHLPTAVANPSGPSSIDDLVSETQNAVIDIRANGSGKVNVSLDMVDEETNSFVRICDMNGRMLELFQIDGSSFEFQMNHGQGIYLVEVSNGLTVEKKKVFVQKG
jgi:hypothetical protein